MAEHRGMRTRSFLLAALVAALLLLVAAFPAGAAGPGTPRTWGSNSFGELGDGTTAPRFAAGPVAGLGDAIELGGGREHVVALWADGSVWTWGANTYGQLGDGTTTRRTSPVPVPGLSGVETVTAGRAYSAAL
jgi:alpha-tubulin suppressor-like RCC1 family protein